MTTQPARCHNDGCADKGWRDLRALHDSPPHTTYQSREYGNGRVCKPPESAADAGESSRNESSTALSKRPAPFRHQRVPPREHLEGPEYSRFDSDCISTESQVDARA